MSKNANRHEIMKRTSGSSWGHKKTGYLAAHPILESCEKDVRIIFFLGTFSSRPHKMSLVGIEKRFHYVYIVSKSDGV